MNDDKERQDQESFEIIVEDKRISRELIESPDTGEAEKSASQQTEQAEPSGEEVAPEKPTGETAKPQTPPATPQEEEQVPLSQEAEEALAESQRVLEIIVQSGIEGVLLGALQQAIILAQVYLGLVPNPKSKMVERDPARASLAIDFLDWVLSRLGPSLNPQERSQLTTLVNQFRQMFVDVFTSLSGGSGGPTPPTGPNGN